MRGVTKESERLRPIESLLSHSLTAFQMVKATIPPQQETDRAFDYRYSIHAPNYAKPAGNLLLVRPRVVGSKAREFLETREPRQFPVEFEGPSQDTDIFEITLPQGYEVEELPRPVDVDLGFASYHSKSEVEGNVLRYTRMVEFKELTVPVNKVEELKKFYRTIAGDERNAAVLRPSGGAR